MTLFAVEGPAGTGKTSRLMEALGEKLIESPLHDGQRVLALTFMHGARRRLHDRLRGVVGLGSRFECATIDSFAWRLLRRWRSLAATLDNHPVHEGEFDEQCDTAGALLERPDVRGWVAASFPIVLIDEAQDLKPQRLRIVSALSPSVSTLVAADEFQCLDSTLHPNPLIGWLHENCQPEILNVIRRTDVPALLTAAATIRAGGAPATGQGLRILAAQGVPMAAAYLANAIAWRQGGKVAVITPSLQGGFARTVIQRVCQQTCGQQGNGPFAIRWERSENDVVTALIDGLDLDEVSSTAEALAAFDTLPRSGPVRDVERWIRHQARAVGKTVFTRAEIEAAITRQVIIRRQRYGADGYDFASMTVQQAKNREFEGVVVLWPYQVGGAAENKRRLLYNALTRARRWCTIIAQNPAILNDPPFG